MPKPGSVETLVRLEDFNPLPDLICLSTSDLGFKTDASRQEIYTAARRMGLLLCPPEVVLKIWLQHPNLLPEGEWAVIAMTPILDESGDFTLFCINYDGPSICDLALVPGHPDVVWETDQYWIFIRGRFPLQ